MSFVRLPDGTIFTGYRKDAPAAIKAAKESQTKQ